MSLYRAGSFAAAARELARSKLDLVRVQEVRWDGEGTVRAILSMEKKLESSIRNRFFLYTTEYY